MQKNYVVHTINGQVLRTGICEDSQFAQQATDGELVTEGTADLWTDYVDGGAVKARPACPAILDGATLSNLPSPCVIRIGEVSHDCTAGEVDLVLPAGEYEVTVSAWPYLPAQLRITADGSATAREGRQAITAPPPVVPVPASVTMRQARLALLRAGALATVSGAIASMPGDAGEAARIEWEYAATVERASALIAGLVPALGMTAAQIDQLFILASTL